MGITYTIDTVNNMVNKHNVGHISVEEEIAFLENVFADPQYKRGMNAICDLTEGLIDWSLTDLDRFRAFIDNRKHVLGNCKWALLATGGITHLTARIFILLHEAFSDSIQIRLFGSKDEAVTWLAEVDSEQPVRRND
jgi:hypothetical protein